jgi:hypothetical protein
MKTNNMKTFDDLQFKPTQYMNGVQSRLQFENGYGVSVVRGDYSYGGRDGLYELAVLGKDGMVTYDTHVTNDVMGHLTMQEVTDTMIEIQNL